MPLNGRKKSPSSSAARRAATPALQKPTIDDVASLAGVGRTTVSRVLNRQPNVSAEVRERVQRAVELLDFKVNVQARNLAGGSAQQVALVHASNVETEPNSYYHSGLELGALRACAERGFGLIMHAVSHIEGIAEKQIRALIDAKRCDGVILTPPLSDRLALVQAINDAACPLACVSAGPVVQQIAASIGIDDAAAGADVTRHLLSLGHRRFAYVRGLSGHVSAELRFDGFCDALRTAGVDPASARVERGDFTFHSGIDAARRILATGERPTAIVCANDDMAAGAMLTLHKMGLEIPRDISVTGFDDTPVSEIVWPPLTTVHQPIKEMGQRAVESLLQAVRGEAVQLHLPIEAVPHRVVIRESSAPPPREQ